MSKIPENIILAGVTGSQAYGLQTDHSDTDYKGIFVEPTESILSIGDFKDTYDGKDLEENDFCYHEVGKFIHLAIKGNPTVLELLFLEGYTVQSKFGHMLVDNRHMFLSSVVRKSYYGYAFSQAQKLNARGGTYGNGRNKRYEKHTRHLFRLLYQGRELLETGNLTVRVSPEVREELFAMGKLSPNEIIDRFTEEHQKFDAIESVLPDKPDLEGINKLLLRIRRGN